MVVEESRVFLSFTAKKEGLFNTGEHLSDRIR